MTESRKHTLAEFVIQRTLDPVMRASPDGRSQRDQEALKRVQEATRAEIERFRSYGSEEEVAVNFKRDLHSAPARKIHAELRRLKLPTIEDIRDEFDEKARELGVNASG